MSLGNKHTRNDSRENKSIGRNMRILQELKEKFIGEGMAAGEAETKAFNMIKDAAPSRQINAN